MHTVKSNSVWGGEGGAIFEMILNKSKRTIINTAYITLVLLFVHLVEQLAGGDGALDVVDDQDFHLVLRLAGLSAHVREEGDIGHVDQSLVDLWLFWVDVETRRRELARFESVNEGFLLHDTPSSRVYENGAILHLAELIFAE